jgi:hypothetical protein
MDAYLTSGNLNESNSYYFNLNFEFLNGFQFISTIWSLGFLSLWGKKTVR